MANAKELNQYTQNVRLIEPGDRVIGGTDAPINQPLQALANRTLYLKTQIESKIGNKGTQVIEGQLNIQTNAWEKIRFTNGDGSYWRFETASVSTGENGARFNYVFTSGGREIGRVQFPRVSGSESVAYQSWVEATAARLVARVDNNVMNVGVPVGAVAYFAQDVPPFGWLKANGAAVSRTIYANLFAAIGERYGRGDGRTTFNLPDLRGEFIRSWDDGRGIDSGRVFSSAQGDAIRNIVGEIGLIQRTDVNKYVAPSGAFTEVRKVSGYIGSGGADDWLTITNFSASNVVPTAAENRPRNIALLACIKA